MNLFWVFDMGVRKGISVIRIAALFGELSLLSALTALSVVIFGVGCGGGVQGTNTAKVAGFVGDASGTPQAGVSVTAFNAAGASIAATGTGENGAFSFEVPLEVASVEFRDETKATTFPLILSADTPDVELLVLEEEEQFVLLDSGKDISAESGDDEESGDPLDEEDGSNTGDNNDSRGGSKPSGGHDGSSGDDDSGSSAPEEPEDGGPGGGVPVPPPTTLPGKCEDAICGPNWDAIVNLVQIYLQNAEADDLPPGIAANVPSYSIEPQIIEGQTSIAISTKFQFAETLTGAAEQVSCPVGHFCVYDRVLSGQEQKVAQFVGEVLSRIGQEPLVEVDNVVWQLEITSVEEKAGGETVLDITAYTSVKFPNGFVVDLSGYGPRNAISTSIKPAPESSPDEDLGSPGSDPATPGKLPPGSFKK